MPGSPTRSAVERPRLVFTKFIAGAAVLFAILNSIRTPDQPGKSVVQRPARVEMTGEAKLQLLRWKKIRADERWRRRHQKRVRHRIEREQDKDNVDGQGKREAAHAPLAPTPAAGGDGSANVQARPKRHRPGRRPRSRRREPKEDAKPAESDAAGERDSADGSDMTPHSDADDARRPKKRSLPRPRRRDPKVMPARGDTGSVQDDCESPTWWSEREREVWSLPRNLQPIVGTGPWSISGAEPFAFLQGGELLTPWGGSSWRLHAGSITALLCGINYTLTFQTVGVEQWSLTGEPADTSNTMAPPPVAGVLKMEMSSFAGITQLTMDMSIAPASRLARRLSHARQLVGTGPWLSRFRPGQRAYVLKGGVALVQETRQAPAVSQINAGEECTTPKLSLSRMACAMHASHRLGLNLDPVSDSGLKSGGCLRRGKAAFVEYTSKWTPSEPCPPATTCFCADDARGQMDGNGEWSRLEWSFGALEDGGLLVHDIEESFLLNKKSLDGVGSETEHELQMGATEAAHYPNKESAEAIPHALIRTGCWALKQPFRVWSQADRATVFPLKGAQSDWNMRLVPLPRAEQKCDAAFDGAVRSKAQKTSFCSPQEQTWMRMAPESFSANGTRISAVVGRAQSKPKLEWLFPCCEADTSRANALIAPQDCPKRFTPELCSLASEIARANIASLGRLMLVFLGSTTPGGLTQFRSFMQATRISGTDNVLTVALDTRAKEVCVQLRAWHVLLPVPSPSTPGSSQRASMAVHKYTILMGLIRLGLAILLVEPYALLRNNPFRQLLHHDADVEVATDGRDDAGVEGSIHRVQDISAPTTALHHSVRVAGVDPGFVYFSPTRKVVLLLERLILRMHLSAETEDERAILSEELFLARRGGAEFSGVFVRIIARQCVANLWTLRDLVAREGFGSKHVTSYNESMRFAVAAEQQAEKANSRTHNGSLVFRPAVVRLHSSMTPGLVTETQGYIAGKTAAATWGQVRDFSVLQHATTQSHPQQPDALHELVTDLMGSHLAQPPALDQECEMPVHLTAPAARNYSERQRSGHFSFCSTIIKQSACMLLLSVLAEATELVVFTADAPASTSMWDSFMAAAHASGLAKCDIFVSLDAPSDKMVLQKRREQAELDEATWRCTSTAQGTHMRGSNRTDIPGEFRPSPESCKSLADLPPALPGHALLSTDFNIRAPEAAAHLAAKYELLRLFLPLNRAVLLVHMDVMLVQDPRPFFWRDVDVELMSAGFEPRSAYGRAVPPGDGQPMVSVPAYDPGLMFVRPSASSKELSQQMTLLLQSNPRVHEGELLTQMLFLPTASQGILKPAATVRLLSYQCFTSSQTLYRTFLPHAASLPQYWPVAVHFVRDGYENRAESFATLVQWLVPKTGSCAVSLKEQHSTQAQCKHGDTFGCDRQGNMWVRDGCRGVFNCGGAMVSCLSKAGGRKSCKCAHSVGSGAELSFPARLRKWCSQKSGTSAFSRRQRPNPIHALVKGADPEFVWATEAPGERVRLRADGSAHFMDARGQAGGHCHVGHWNASQRLLTPVVLVTRCHETWLVRFNAAGDLLARFACHDPHANASSYGWMVRKTAS